MKSSLTKALLFILILATTSCIKVDTGSNMPTMGSQLIDLARAKEMGKLTDQEFEDLRRKVLASF